MLKELWKDPVWSAVIAACIIATAGALGAYLFGYWPVLAQLVLSGWNFLRSSSEMPNWLVALLIIGVVPTVIILVALASQLLRGQSASLVDWSNYTTDEFFGLRWRWLYSGGYIINLHTFCPKCDYQVFARDVSNYDFVDRIQFVCESCNSDLVVLDESPARLDNKVQRFIQQKIRNNSWRSVGVT